jgi:hypothetical protein
MGVQQVRSQANSAWAVTCDCTKMVDFSGSIPVVETKEMYVRIGV